MRAFLAALVNQDDLKTREGNFVDMSKYSTWCYLLRGLIVVPLTASQPFRQWVTVGRAALHRSRSARLQATARPVSCTGCGNLSSAIRLVDRRAGQPGDLHDRAHAQEQRDRGGHGGGTGGAHGAAHEAGLVSMMENHCRPVVIDCPRWIRTEICRCGFNLKRPAAPLPQHLCRANQFR